MVLQDRGGGTISTVTYGSKDPITKTLKTFPDRPDRQPDAGRPARPGPRRAGRGRRPQRDHRHDPGRREAQARKSARTTTSSRVEFLNLLTDDGLRSVPLDIDRPHQAGSTRSSTPSCARPWPCWPRATTPTRRPSRSNFLGKASARSASATSRRRRSGRPATGWCCDDKARRSCKAGRSSRTRPRRTGTTWS